MNRAIILPSYMEILEGLDNTELQCKFVFGIINYQMKNEEPYFTDKTLQLLWLAIKPNLDSSIERYNKSVENGKKGGRPKKTKDNLTKPNNNLKKPNDNLKVLEEKPIGSFSKTQEKLKKEKEKDTEKKKDTNTEMNIEKEMEIILNSKGIFN